MSGFALSLNTVPIDYSLLVRASMNFKAGKAEEALEDFNAVSPQLPVELVQNIYFKVWVFSNRPEGDPNFGEKAMHNRLVSETLPDDTVKAMAIMEAFIEHCPGAIHRFMEELDRVESCPISHERMKDPVILFSGQTFDRLQIQEEQRQQLRRGVYQTVCPTTHLKGSSQLIRNHVMENIIEITTRYEHQLKAIPLLTYYLFEENVRYEHEAKRKDAEIEALRIQNAQTHRLIEQFTLLNLNHELHRQESAEHIRTLTEQHQEAQLQNQFLVQRVDSLLQQSQTLETTNQALSSANQTLSSEVQSKNHQIQDLTHDLQQARQNHTVMNQIQNITIASLQRRLHDLERRGPANPLATATSLPTTEIILKAMDSGIFSVNYFFETVYSTFHSLHVKA